MISVTPITATAQPNIALIKYWGKSDEALILPTTGSFSLTLEGYGTTTTVTANPALSADQFTLNGEGMTGVKAERVFRFLDLVRSLVPLPAEDIPYVEVDSHNLVPTAAGLASSASGFAALAVAASAAYGIHLSPRELSILARQGSGSASRSIFSGFAIWHAGSHEESFAEEVDANGLDLGMTIVEISREEKTVSSREAMKIVQETSPVYLQWTKHNARMLNEMLTAVANKNFSTIGRLTEASSAGMHQAMKMATPEIWYPTEDSIRVMNYISTLRSQGLECYGTMDAGPNVKILSQRKDFPAIHEALTSFIPDAGLIQSGMGQGARIIPAGAVS